ncbi:MAG TPA: DUF1428 domain-containing protein [Planctomycetota bacterium]
MYVDGFLLPLPKKNLGAYKKMATLASKVWRDHGALQYVEAVGEDMTPGFGLPFPKLAKAKAGETMVFAYIVYKSRAHRDAVNKKVMKDKRLHDSCDADDMPFDIKRMAWGGFKGLVSR